VWIITIPKNKVNNIQVDEIVRMRSVCLDVSSKRNKLIIKPISNILRFYSNALIVKELKSGIREWSSEEKAHDENNQELIMSAVHATQTIASVDGVTYSHESDFRLNDLFLDFEGL